LNSYFFFVNPLEHYYPKQYQTGNEEDCVKCRGHSKKGSWCEDIQGVKGVVENGKHET
jgi:hypothetical protein